MAGKDEFYPLGKGVFRPEFSFSFEDDKNATEAKIIKEPKMKFQFAESIEEAEVAKCGDIVRLLASFFFHADIDYSITNIYLSKSTVTIKKVQRRTILESYGGLWPFGLNWHFDKFMKSKWQESTLRNHKKLSIAIKLFIQSLSVGGSSSFLIRFNIIELCMGGIKSGQPKFELVLSGAGLKKKYDRALNILLETVNEVDHEQFRNKWQGIIEKLSYKPMDSPIEEFLIKEKLPVDKFPISVRRLKKIRDYLTHGSIKSIKTEELEKANKLLYGVTGVLILNLIGIRDWELHTDIN